MTYKRIIPCIFVKDGRAVKWFDNPEVVDEDPIALAKFYNLRGADELLVFDLSDDDEEHEDTLDLVKRMNRAIQIPTIVGGNIRRAEDVQKILYAGAKRAILNLAKSSAVELFEEVSLKFGKERIAVSLNDFDALFKQQHLIEEYCSEILFMHRLDLDSIINITKKPCIVLTDTMDEEELIQILKSQSVMGLAGKYVSNREMDFESFKEKCTEKEIKMASFESQMDFAEFHLDCSGLLPIVVQNYKTDEVLMLAYMNEAAFEQTIKTGRMTYFDQRTQMLWTKGETDGHFQFVKSLIVDCNKESLLAKVDPVGPACRNGNPSCFYQSIVGSDYDETSPRQVLERVYDTIRDRKENPKEGSYTNYLFEKGIDKILKKVGEEATELIIAAKNPNPEEIKYELSDFLYHAMVLMVEKGVTWEEIIRELADR